MKTIPLTKINIPANRQRREFDPALLNETAESIRKNGLFHAITLRFGDPRRGETVEERYLVSGERRIRCVYDIYAMGGSFKHDNEAVPEGEIPFTDLGDLDEEGREEAELEENIRRVDLTWQERADATLRLETLRTKQAEKAGVPRPTVAAIAVEVRGSSAGVNQENTRREIIVAKHLKDPEVKAAKSVDEAFKILKRKEDVQRRVDLAANIGKTYTAETAHTVLNEDSLEWMKKCEKETFHVICTDPIFGIGADEFGDSGGHTQGAHQYKDDYETWKLHAGVLAREGFRICKAQAHLYAFCDITRFAEFKEILKKEGWEPFRTPITWHYPNGNRTPWVDGGPQRKSGWILFARKGRMPVTRIYPDVVTYSADENLGHNAQKPVALFVDLLRRSVAPGYRVLDPFGGSGPMLPAAHELKCMATVIEIAPPSYALCVERLKKLSEAPELAGL